MVIEYEVWGVPPGKKKRLLEGCYQASRWQWAEKYAATLIDYGYTKVEVREIEAEEE